MQKNFNRILLLTVVCLFVALIYKLSTKYGRRNNSELVETHVVDTLENSAPNDKAEVENIIKNYLMDNPEVIVSAVEKLQKDKAAQAESKMEQYLEEKNFELNDSVNSPFLGNENGDFIIVVFYDYNCSYCKKGDNYVRQSLSKHDNLKVVLKPFPILGDDSIYLAKLALSVYKIAPDKFKSVHIGLMDMQIPSKEKITELLKSNDIDESLLEQEMQSSDVQNLINKNFEYANNLGLRGAPAYVVNGKLIPGLIKPEVLEKMIEDASSK